MKKDGLIQGLNGGKKKKNSGVPRPGTGFINLCHDRGATRGRERGS